MRPLLALLILLGAAPLSAKDSLGVFGQWGAFRDGEVPRCYAIAAGEDTRARREHVPFVSIGSWPRRQLRGQVYLRLSRTLAPQPRLRLTLAGQSFELAGNGTEAWAPDARTDAAIIAAMRSASRMSVSANDARGNRFSDRYSLEGAATAIDAASLGCARR